MVKHDRCDCPDYKPEMEKINAPIILQQIRNPSYVPNFKLIEYCPWCGKKLKPEKIPMNIRAKVQCIAVTGNENVKLVNFHAVYSSDKTTENYSFSQATPSLNISMSITNPDAFNAFEQGKEYYLDFTPASV